MDKGKLIELATVFALVEGIGGTIGAAIGFVLSFTTLPFLFVGGAIGLSLSAVFVALGLYTGHKSTKAEVVLELLLVNAAAVGLYAVLEDLYPSFISTRFSATIAGRAVGALVPILVMIAVDE